MNAFATTDRNIYGAIETNGLVNGHEYHAQTDNSRRYSLAEVKAEGGKITRVRMFQEMGRIDVSYIHAVLKDGRQVEVTHPLGFLIPKNRLKKSMLDWAQSEGVFAKSIGLIDEGNWSILR
jgi:hypothetical protein